MAETKIEWTRGPNGEQGFSFNPWLGCSKVSDGCTNCYAERWAKQYGTVQWGKDRKRTSVANWNLPLKWNRQAAKSGTRPRVFCASLADVFDNQVPLSWRMDLFTLISKTPNLDWLILTKRIGNVLPMCSGDGLMFDMICQRVWLGATICNQEEADRDIPKLLQIPAAVRFLSIEPMLGPIDLTWEDRSDGMVMRKIHPIDWAIVGGESGPNARPMHPEWARSLRDQCAASGVPFMFKQWGTWAPAIDPPFEMQRWGKTLAGRTLDGVIHDGYPEVKP